MKPTQLKDAEIRIIREAESKRKKLGIIVDRSNMDKRCTKFNSRESVKRIYQELYGTLDGIDEFIF